MVIGLTGGIASGKSTMIEYALEHGAHVIDADKLGHQVYEPGTHGFDAVVAEFGKEILGSDRTIDRKILGAKVFADGGDLTRLTDIVWPEIKNLARTEIAKLKSLDPDKYIVLEATVLIEANWQELIDELWVVVVDKETAISRAVARDGLPREAVESRMNAQLTNEERTKHADVVLDNSFDKAHLLTQIDKQFHRLGQNEVSFS